MLTSKFSLTSCIIFSLVSSATKQERKATRQDQTTDFVKKKIQLFGPTQRSNQILSVWLSQPQLCGPQITTLNHTFSLVPFHALTQNIFAGFKKTLLIILLLYSSGGLTSHSMFRGFTPAPFKEQFANPEPAWGTVPLSSNGNLPPTHPTPIKLSV